MVRVEKKVFDLIRFAFRSLSIKIFVSCRASLVSVVPLCRAHRPCCRQRRWAAPDYALRALLLHVSGKKKRFMLIQPNPACLSQCAVASSHELSLCNAPAEQLCRGSAALIMR